ncbi:DUF7660 family protein [Streptomyces tauricus]|uniref:DUF7660 family protein n=1 Tax=Streptomyces tauricus TaxID=68274 RepID=UPI0033B24C53
MQTAPLHQRGQLLLGVVRGQIRLFSGLWAAWIDDADGVYRNFRKDLPPGGDWTFFARSLQAATVYE